MSRDVVFATLALVLGGMGAWLASWIPARRHQADGPDVSGRALERRSWRRLWLTMSPAAIALATLIGWAMQEPSITDEPLRPVVLIVALPLALLWVRSAVRAGVALRRPRPMPPIATVGIVRSRIEIAPELPGAIDDDALAAAIAHERIHVRHRDPLRIWLAQIATDLQWPSPSARRRLDRWLANLELARDEEARREGTSGQDLAAAIVAVARLPRPVAPGAIAMLTGAEAALILRVRRLLGPLPRDTAARSIAVPIVVVLSLALGIVVGAIYGDDLLRALPFIAA